MIGASIRENRTKQGITPDVFFNSLSLLKVERAPEYTPRKSQTSEPARQLARTAKAIILLNVELAR